jgi:peptidoglycan/xylan/chitin deacetylase (PgdA/CDA1 family)
MTQLSSGPSSKIRPYRVVDSGRSEADVLGQINLSCFECYGPDMRVGPHPDAGRVTVDTLAQYEKLIRALASIEHLVFVPHTELNDYGCPADKLVCSIRHDVDADIRAAVAEAEIEQRYGARTSYYILHTAPYYGTWIDGVHHRNGCMARLYRQMQDLGHEIALHTDPLHLYQNMHLDGAQAVREEIDWLREQGLHITGTVAHNSAPIYGIENFAIFRGKNRKGLALGSRGEPGDELLDEIVHDGKWAPLGVLDEATMGLTYEGNDFFRRKDIRIEYGATRYLNRWRWDAHLKRWRISKDMSEDRFVDQERMIEEIRTLPGGVWLILNVHPLYYGSRPQPKGPPPMELDRVSIVVNKERGWETYEPGAVQAAHGREHGQIEFQSINFADERGMLDVPLPAGAAGECRVLLLGGRNIDGREVGIPEHCHRQAGARLSEALSKPVRVRKAAFAGMGLCRHFAWFEQALAEEPFDMVIIGLGADELAGSHPLLWSLSTGFSAKHPPSRYLWADEGQVKVVERSRGAWIRRMKPNPPSPLPSLAEPSTLKGAWTRDQDAIGQCLKFYAERAAANGARVFAMLTECGESAGYWRGAGTDDAGAHARTVRAVGPWIQAAGLELIDPYVRFLAHEGAPTHWRASGTWSHTGHRLAARAIYDHLRPAIEASATPASRTTT